MIIQFKSDKNLNKKGLFSMKGDKGPFSQRLTKDEFDKADESRYY